MLPSVQNRGYNMHKNQESFSAHIKELNIVNPMSILHNLKDEISTYASSPNRVDFMFVSQELLEFVNACGYDPFNENVFSDHRLMFMDIDKKLFHSENFSKHQRQQRGVNSSNPKSIYTYVTTLKDQARHHQFQEKIDTFSSYRKSYWCFFVSS